MNYIFTYIFNRLKSNHIKLYIPEYPKYCCGCGCTNCTFLTYYKEKDIYKEYFKS